MNSTKLSQDSLRKLNFTAVNISEIFLLFLFIGLLAYIVHNAAFFPFLSGLAFRTKGCKYNVVKFYIGLSLESEESLSFNGKFGLLWVRNSAGE